MRLLPRSAPNLPFWRNKLFCEFPSETKTKMLSCRRRHTQESDSQIQLFLLHIRRQNDWYQTETSPDFNYTDTLNGSDVHRKWNNSEN